MIRGFHGDCALREETSMASGDAVPDLAADGARIGAQLKAARLAARMTMAEVAEQAGLTKGFVSKLERDLANVSVASLIRLCDALGISVGSLFQAPKGEVVRRDTRPRINFGGRKMTEYLLTPAGEKRVQAILSDIEPGGDRKSTRLNSSHMSISYAVFCLKKKKQFTLIAHAM